MEKVKKWLTGASLAAVVLRLALAVTASLTAGGDPLVALCAALAAESGLLGPAPQL